MSKVLADHDLVAVPVVDAEGRMKGIVTVDDIVDVVQEEATEDIQKIGGMEALDAPYLRIGFWRMIRKRGGWLSALFLGEMLTATAMGFYEKEIARAVVLALFVPLIISSGGNSGSQATTLVIRAMALGEVRLRDWWRVVRRELGAGLVLGACSASIGFLRIIVWQAFFAALRRALPARRAHRRREPGRRGDVRHAGGLAAAVRPAAPRLRPGERVGAVRGHAGRRDRAPHLLLRREPDPARHALVMRPAARRRVSVRPRWRRIAARTTSCRDRRGREAPGGRRAPRCDRGP